MTIVPSNSVVDVSIIVVSYNTREMTLACLRSVYDETKEIEFEIIVVENDSTDGSAEAIEREFPNAMLIQAKSNLGFAGGNNLAAAHARGAYLLLLNPDTVVLDGAIQKLLQFAQCTPSAQIWGGRTVFADGSLNPSSCWRQQTPWSMLCRGVGLAALLRHSAIFNPEAMGGWNRDSERDVDIISGCFLLIERSTWDRLGGFDRQFFMYGEEADLCLRAKAIGCQPRFTPDAAIIHYGGGSERVRADKVVRLLTARLALVERHWPVGWRPWGRLMHRLWVLRRAVAWGILARLRIQKATAPAETFARVWGRRREWLMRGTAPASAGVGQ